MIPTPMTPTPRQDLAGRLLGVAEAVERRIGGLTAALGAAALDPDSGGPDPMQIGELAGLVWVATKLQPLVAGARQRGKEAPHE